MSEAEHQMPAPLTNQRFATTHWSVVLAAKGPDTSDAAAALERLCRTYWAALYAYVRRAGHPPADAADLTQAFFARFLEKQFLQDVDRQKGKFRSFLLKTLNHFLADEWRHAHAEKRAGSHPVISINAEEWETRHGHELATETTPEKLFERRTTHRWEWSRLSTPANYCDRPRRSRRNPPSRRSAGCIAAPRSYRSEVQISPVSKR